MPAKVGAALEVVQAQAVLELAVVVLDGLITNDKFCCVRRLRLGLTWWARPLRVRCSALPGDVSPVGRRDEPDVGRLPAAQPPSRRRTPVGFSRPAVSE